MEDGKHREAAPCGLYCGICADYRNDICHGCGCDCGKCIGKDHAQGCDIAKCVNGRRLESCADCKEFPCSRLIQFTVDPVWRTHSPCIENLRRQKKIGTKAWIREQEAFWQDDKRRRAWNWLGSECERRMEEFRKTDGKQD